MNPKYAIIYADPPWEYNNRGRGAAENHYPTMSLQELCKLPVNEIAADNSVLFLWATFPQIKEAITVMESWGFRYKTIAFLWVKKNRKSDSWFTGLGFWTRSNAEVCLLGVRGKPKRTHAGIHQLVIAPVQEHSKKPDEVREKIVSLMGDLPRIELFARQGVPGWDIWGNEVSNSIDLKCTG